MSFTLDSQCFTYLIDALSGIERPEGVLAEEKVSLVRIFFYVASHFEITPEVFVEINKISDPERLDNHLSWTKTHFAPRQFWKSNQHQLAQNRYEEFLTHHKKESDCRILAQAEVLGFSTLLSYDFAFVDKLSRRTTINLLKPKEYWQSCGVVGEAQPKVRPHFSNPLFKMDWWRV